LDEEQNRYREKKVEKCEARCHGKSSRRQEKDVKWQGKKVSFIFRRIGRNQGVPEESSAVLKGDTEQGQKEWKAEYFSYQGEPEC